MVCGTQFGQDEAEIGDAVTNPVVEASKEEREKKLKKLFGALQKIVDDRWFGKVTISFQAGNITHVVQEVVSKW
jgi:hypothetical protein